MTVEQYNEAVREYSGRLYRFLLKSSGNAEDASDIVQESYLKLWQNRKKVDYDKVRSWLFTTGYRTMLNMVKRENRMQSIEETDYLEPEAKPARNFELREIINNALNQLPAVQRSIILLRDLEGYNYKEIGDMLDLTESQVKVYLFRGRQKLKTQLKNLTVIA